MAMMSTAGLRLVRHLPAVRLHQICAPTLSADGRRHVVASAVRRMNDVNDLFSFKMELSEHKSPISKLAVGVGVVVSAVRCMNEVNNARRARLVLEWVIVSVSRYVKSQLGQLSLASLWGHLVEYQLRLGSERGEI